MDNEDVRACLARMIQSLTMDQAVNGGGYILGRQLGNGTLVAFTYLSTRGRSDNRAKAGKLASIGGYQLAAMVGNMSNFISQNGNPASAQLAQVFTFGEVIASDMACECEGAE